MSENKLVQDWLKRAKSNLEKAKAGKVTEGILFEDLCYDCQQAVEKSLKALLINRNIEFPWTHSISKLLEIAEQSGIYIPDEIKDSVILTDYAVETRYPGDYAPVDEDMYKEALKLAEKVVSWVEKILEADKK
jgi:HEPN domain-containing protein